MITDSEIRSEWERLGGVSVADAYRGDKNAYSRWRQRFLKVGLLKKREHVTFSSSSAYQRHWRSTPTGKRKYREAQLRYLTKILNE
jgi:hypothetical protein